MDIISKIKQELNYDVLDKNVVNQIYKLCLKSKKTFTCLTVGRSTILIYDSDNGKSWGSRTGVQFMTANIEKDMAALSLCLENTFIEILCTDSLNNFIKHNNFNNVCIYIGLNQAEQIFYILQDVTYRCLLKLFVHIYSFDEEENNKEFIKHIIDFFGNTVIGVIWL